MQDTLYPLNFKDVEAIGRSRANRAISRNLKIWMWASLVVCMIGLYYAYVVNAMIGIIIMIGGCVSLFLYSNQVDKIRKIVVKRLKKEWQEEIENDKTRG